MFRILIIILLFGAVTWFFYAMRSRMIELKMSSKNLFVRAVDSLKKFKNPRLLSFSDLINCLKVLSYFIVVICALVLALTGFIPYILSGDPPTGYTLILHVSAAPFFAVCITLLTMLGAHRHPFNKADRLKLKYIFNPDRYKENIPAKKSALKISFWLLVFLAPVIMGSILLSMYPVFNTTGQEILLFLHLLSSLLFLIIGIVHTFLLINLSVIESKME